MQEVDDEIAKTQAALAAAEKSPQRDQTTDVNPVHLWIDSELAKARADLPSLNSRADSLARTIEDYDSEGPQHGARQLNYQDLLRNATAAEQDYLLYEKKREEARISNRESAPNPGRERRSARHRARSSRRARPVSTWL